MNNNNKNNNIFNNNFITNDNVTINPYPKVLDKMNNIMLINNQLFFCTNMNQNFNNNGILLPNNLNNSSNNNILIIFGTSTGIEIEMNVSINISIHELLSDFIKNVNLDKKLIGKKIYFLFLGKKLEFNDNSNILDCGLNNKSKIVVVYYDNLIR